jgi:hypothetical protein
MDQNPKPDLQALLEIVLGSENVYFQPPSDTEIEYPCIIYSRDSADAKHANDKLYLYRPRYQVIVVDRDPDSPIVRRVAAIPMCRYDRRYVADNLNHDVFNIYY